MKCPDCSEPMLETSSDYNYTPEAGITGVKVVLVSAMLNECSKCKKSYVTINRMAELHRELHALGQRHGDRIDCVWNGIAKEWSLTFQAASSGGTKRTQKKIKKS